MHSCVWIAATLMHTCTVSMLLTAQLLDVHIRVENTTHFFLDCPLYNVQRLSLRNTVTRSSEFSLGTLLYGDYNLDYESNIAILLAVHEFIKDSERFWLCILYVYISKLHSIDYNFHLKGIIHERFYYLTVAIIALCSLVSECMVLYMLVTLVWVCCVNVYDWLSMLVQLHMLFGRGLQHSMCSAQSLFM